MTYICNFFLKKINVTLYFCYIFPHYLTIFEIKTIRIYLKSSSSVNSNWMVFVIVYKIDLTKLTSTVMIDWMILLYLKHIIKDFISSQYEWKTSIKREINILNVNIVIYQKITHRISMVGYPNFLLKKIVLKKYVVLYFVHFITQFNKNIMFDYFDLRN